MDLPADHKEKYSIEFSAHKVIELIEEIANRKSITVVSFSLGAQLLVQMLSIKPNLIDYAIINSASVRLTIFGKKLISPLIRLTIPLVKNRIFFKTSCEKIIYR